MIKILKLNNMNLIHFKKKFNKIKTHTHNTDYVTDAHTHTDYVTDAHTHIHYTTLVM